MALKLLAAWVWEWWVGVWVTVRGVHLLLLIALLQIKAPTSCCLYALCAVSKARRCCLHQATTRGCAVCKPGCVAGAQHTGVSWREFLLVCIMADASAFVGNCCPLHDSMTSCPCSAVCCCAVLPSAVSRCAVLCRAVHQVAGYIESVGARPTSSFRMSLQAQCKALLDHTHARSMQQLQGLLEAEQWVAVDVPAGFQVG